MSRLAVVCKLQRPLLGSRRILQPNSGLFHKSHCCVSVFPIAQRRFAGSNPLSPSDPPLPSSAPSKRVHRRKQHEPLSNDIPTTTSMNRKKGDAGQYLDQLDGILARNRHKMERKRKVKRVGRKPVQLIDEEKLFGKNNKSGDNEKRYAKDGSMGSFSSSLPSPTVEVYEVQGSSYPDSSTGVEPNADSHDIFGFAKSSKAPDKLEVDESAPSKPLLDNIFGIPSLPADATMSPSGQDANDKELSPYEEYLKLLDTHIENRKFARRHTAKPIPDEKIVPAVSFLKNEGLVVPFEYPQLEEALLSGDLSATANPKNVDKENRDAFRSQLKTQKELFMAQMDFDEEQYRTVQNSLQYMAGQTAKFSKAGLIPFIWGKVKECGMATPELVHSLMHVGSSFAVEKNNFRRAKNSNSILDVLGGMPLTKASNDEKGQELEVDEEIIYKQLEEMAAYHDLMNNPTEQTIHSRVRLLVSQGKGKAAEQLLRNVDKSLSLHLRVFVPVMLLFLEQKEVKSALSIYRLMRQLDTVHMDADTYVQLIAGIAEQEGFNPETPPIEGLVEELGFSSESGPKLFDELVREMSEDIVDIPPMSARRLHNALATGMAGKSTLVSLGTLESLRINNVPASADEKVIASRVKVDHSSGVCPRTGVKLQLKHLTEKQKQTLISKCRELAVEARKKWKHGKNVKGDGKTPDEHLDLFLEWLDLREGEPFTAIVDGANVGYYMQNFDNGIFNFHQINFVVDALTQRGENPLVVLPQKYMMDSFYIQTGGYQRKQRLSREDMRIRSSLLQSGKMAVSPSGVLDDFYWILASVSNQTASRQDKDLTVPTDTSRWPGIRPVLISNDQMRDHRLGMLEPMVFRRWSSNHIVNYNFAGFEGDKCNRSGIGFSPVDFYSREIQCNQNAKGANVWHFPLVESSNEWFCVCLEN